MSVVPDRASKNRNNSEDQLREELSRLRARIAQLEAAAAVPAERPRNDASWIERTLYDKLPLMYFATDAAGVILSVNSYGARQLGYESPELIGRSVLTLFHEADRQAVREALDECLAQPGPVKSWGFRKIRKDGSLMWVRESACAVESDGKVVVLVVCEDATERRQAQQQLIEYQRQLQSLTSELTLAEERERRRVAVGLHDHIGQELALARRAVGELLKEDSHDSSRATLERMSSHLNRAIEAVRSFTFELSSPILYELGLEPALENLGESMFSDGGTSFRFACEERPPRLVEKAKIAVFRIARELLCNVMRHSRASRVTMSLRRSADEMMLVVKDDGVGFDASKPPRVNPNGGFGLFSVQEQLKSMGGRLEIDSAKGRGTRAVVLLPVGRTSDEKHRA